MNNLAKVDDFCTKLDIGLVKINDLELVTEYNLGELPALVYYRHGVPILYEGDTRGIHHGHQQSSLSFRRLESRG